MRRSRLLLLTLLGSVAACADQPLEPESGPQYSHQEGVAVAPLMASAVAAGRRHACAIGVDRRTYCWGHNDVGQLGDATNDVSLTPVPVVGRHVFEELTAGWEYTCGRTSAGAVWCWGQNGFGQLGNEDTTPSNVPVRAHPELTFTSVDAGTYHACGIATDGSTYCWGSNGPALWGGGQDGWAFGAPTTDMCVNPQGNYRGLEWHCSLTPVQVPGPELTTVDAGLWATCGLTSAGTAYCTGWNTVWGLGNGSTTHAQAMTTVAGGLAFDGIEVGSLVGCGVAASAAYCWGGRLFNNGTTGNGTMDGTSVPAAVVGGLSLTSYLPTDANTIWSHACGLTASGEAFCTGTNRYGALGTEASLEPCAEGGGSWTCSSSPVPVAGPSFTDLATGQEFTCGVGRDRKVYCWGRNDDGQVGDGTTEDRFTPTLVRAPAAGDRRPSVIPPRADRRVQSLIW